MDAPPVPAIVHPAPHGEEQCGDHLVEVDGKPLFVHRARVSAMPFNQVWPGYQRPLDQTEVAGFVSWGMSGPVQLRITPRQPFTTATVRPRAAGIAQRRDGASLLLTIPRPGQFTVEFDGSMHHALHCFADPPEVVPAPGPDVLSFGPGVHDAGLITARSGQTIHLAGGAVVYGAIHADGARNVRITGRGILDASRCTREEFNRQEGAQGAICLHDCRDCVVEGITIRDPHAWTVIPVNCERITIANIKLIGLWRYNADGIDVVNSREVTIRDSFVRAFDDCIVVKGLKAWGPWPAGERPVEDILVERCVTWCDWGRCLEIGAETVAPRVSRLTFRDCDLIHVNMVALDVQHGDRAAVEDVLFERIRVEMDDHAPPPQFQGAPDQVYTGKPGDGHLAQLLVVGITANYWSRDQQRGTVKGVHLRDIQVTAPRVPESLLFGADAEHRVQGVTITGLTFNGTPATTLEQARVAIHPFVEAVTIQP